MDRGPRPRGPARADEPAHRQARRGARGRSAVRDLPLRLYNVSLSIDDFGSAYASLARLRDLPFVEIKLDRGFVESCTDNPLNRGVCATVIDLAHRFQASLCAEGVETEEDLHCLMAMGCDTAQGYLFAKPMPREAISAFIEQTQPAHEAGRDEPVPARAVA